MLSKKKLRVARLAGNTNRTSKKSTDYEFSTINSRNQMNDSNRKTLNPYSSQIMSERQRPKKLQHTMSTLEPNADYFQKNLK